MVQNSVLYNLTLSDDQKIAVSEDLQQNWNDLGLVALELPDTISLFISGVEFEAHFEVVRTIERWTFYVGNGIICYTRTHFYKEPYSKVLRRMVLLDTWYFYDPRIYGKRYVPCTLSRKRRRSPRQACAQP
ncbi:uncharacterized protein EV420DRAFT_724737 [Desarmillaria tabescens]|uniref:Uncharacterized protein n=1 Tax=Armillaria tabescens TaxID=1929756 RepID=A0AA39JY97_ARMTA|nr:uncharacterized protein EV420DRAFT_724737 [Desarmillaria tabescens]KAK0451161.1 hypothetical protein EV420DRAFT_724737 [Desarmillaria tabescens]